MEHPVVQQELTGLGAEEGLEGDEAYLEKTILARAMGEGWKCCMATSMWVVLLVSLRMIVMWLLKTFHIGKII